MKAYTQSQSQIVTDTPNIKELGISEIYITVRPIAQPFGLLK
jgi:hypothetical protein